MAEHLCEHLCHYVVQGLRCMFIVFISSIVLLVGTISPVAAMILTAGFMPCILCVIFPQVFMVIPVGKQQLLDVLVPRGASIPVAPNQDTVKNGESLRKCETIIQNLKRGIGSRNMSEIYERVFTYKNQWLDGTILHYAVWRSSKRDLLDHLSDVFDQLDAAGTLGRIDRTNPFNCDDQNAEAVQLVLMQRPDVFARAHCKHLRLEAFHIAAGSDALQAMLRLEAAIEPRNRFRDLNHPVMLADHRGALEEDGNALHEAAWHSNLKTMEWLLNRGVDPKVSTSEGVTPLHLLAMVGGPKDELKKVIELLLDKRAKVDAMTSDSCANVNFRSSTPLMISGVAGSQYPRCLNYLLTSSWHEAKAGIVNREGSSFLDDLLAVPSDGDANALADFLLKNEVCHHNLRLDCQVPGAAQKLAKLLYVCPQAAGDVLKILTVAPEVPDPMRCPLTTRASLWGFFEPVNMRCTYQTDTVDSSGIRWPCWYFWKGLKKSWQFFFLKDVYTSGSGRKESVYDVEIKVLLAPNILDVNVIWALARTWNFYDRIFLSIPVQGMINCLWTNVVMKVELLDLALKLFDLGAMVAWTFLEKITTEDDELATFRYFLPLCWTILAACFFREFVQLLKWFLGFWYMSVMWRKHFPADHRPKHGIRKLLPSYKMSLWSLRAFFTQSRAGFDLMAVMLPLGGFLAYSFEEDRGKLTRSTVSQTLLCYSIFVRGVDILVSLRTMTGVGQKVLSIFATVFSKNVKQIMSIMVSVFACAVFAYQALMPKARIGWITMYLFRGSIVGDGDGLDNMGMAKAKVHTFHQKALCCFMFACTFTYFVVLLNLAIAVFEREYRSAMSQATKTFHQVRANTIVKNMLALSLSSPSARLHKWICPCFTNWLVIVVCLVGGIVMPLKHDSADNKAAFIGAVILGFGQVWWKMMLMRSSWLPPDLTQEHFLWICHRDDFDESRNHAADAEIDLNDIDNLQRKLTDFEETINEKLDKLIQTFHHGASG
eukprot:TRINITY_DN7469_c0_g1_i1.p1 TRINITY_DN7469_c0_g1~~TRINITY_DN7469_c0_g1_i1.p1  ORF type:complete len:995 (-),score=170.33 TRINITY_DN7469_c0_g1_i1:292-3276(-)